jgi:hypothetical protein
MVNLGIIKKIGGHFLKILKPTHSHAKLVEA